MRMLVRARMAAAAAVVPGTLQMSFPAIALIRRSSWTPGLLEPPGCA